MPYRLLGVSVAGLALLGTPTQASAVIIDFETLAVNSVSNNGVGGSYSEDGFTLNGNTLAFFGTLEPRFSGSTAIFNDHDGVTALTQDNGNPFSVQSIDLAEISSNTPATVTFTGMLSGGER